jgi:hypothetical protein
MATPTPDGPMYAAQDTQRSEAKITRRRWFFIFPPVAFIALFLLLLLLPDLPDQVGLNPDRNVSRAVIRAREELIPQRCSFASPTSFASRHKRFFRLSSREVRSVLFSLIY